MEKNNSLPLLMIAMTIVVVGIATYFIASTKKEISKDSIESTQESSKDSEPTTKPSKKNIVEGKKYVTANNESYIMFSNKDTYVKYYVKSSGSHTTENGKYSVNNKRITLNKIKKDAYYNEDYILLNDGLIDENLYTMYYIDSKNDAFIMKLSKVLPDYIKEEVETASGLKSILKKIELESVDYCFKYTSSENEFSCSINYKIFVENYDPKKESEYDNFFAGSGPTYKKDYISRWSFFTFKPYKEDFTVTKNFTGI